MTLNEMRTCAAETPTFFIRSMPDVPFKEDGIVFYFAKKNDMADRAVELCAKYCPEKILSGNQLSELNESIAANALFGREKSAVLVRINTKLSKKDFRRILIHELMHIFCGLLEVDGEHFIDIFGSGTTPEADPENKIYDGVVTAGYDTWSEFIAHYYAVRFVDGENLEFANMANFITNLLGEVNVYEIIGGKKSFSMICSHWLNCTDFLETLNWLSNPGILMSANEPYGADAQQSLFQCLEFLYRQIQ